MYDVIIVGARIAGSALSIHLAKQGIKVLLVDRTTFPRDTLSTHFLWARGVSYLNRLGVLDEVLARTPATARMQFVMEGIELEGETPLPLIEERLERVHGDAAGATNLQLSVRRKFLDYLLIQKAIALGVEFREGFPVDKLLFENGRVVGIQGSEKIRARIVVGADGRQSKVAELLQLPKKEIRLACSFAQYSYFSGLKLKLPTIRKKGRLALGIVPTNDGACMTLVFGPKDWFPAFRRDPEANFMRALDYIAPELSEMVRTNGRREEPFYATADQAAFLRDPVGSGYLLAGDAASFKDQCTASGMTHALRDAELAAVAIRAALQGEERPALTEYRQKRSLDYFRYYEFVASQAEMNPLRPDEYQFFEALAASPEDTNRFVATYGDTLPVRDFFSDESTQTILARRQHLDLDLPSYRKRLEASYQSPFSDETMSNTESVSLSRTCVDFANPVGSDLLGRTAAYSAWVFKRNESGTWQYSRTLEAFPGPTSRLMDDLGRKIEGINFASQDYLALGAHPAIGKAAIQALGEFGPHSAGSPMVIGNTTLSQKLEAELGEALQCKEVTLFPTGWAAGYGSIIGLVRPHDHIVMDKLAHACLQQGAYSATDKIHRHAHLDVDSARAILKDIRARDRRNGILVISEGIYSMDSDAPDLVGLQEACHEYGATLFVDVAHDFGASGPQGTGQIGIQGAGEDRSGDGKLLQNVRIERRVSGDKCAGGETVRKDVR